MELDYGRGKLVWSQLDLEDHATLDPRRAASGPSVVNYATTSPLAPRTPVSYIGGAAGSALLNSLGVQFRNATALPLPAWLLSGRMRASATRNSKHSHVVAARCCSCHDATRRARRACD
jgi:hypothetical protein